MKVSAIHPRIKSRVHETKVTTPPRIKRRTPKAKAMASQRVITEAQLRATKNRSVQRARPIIADTQKTAAIGAIGVIVVLCPRSASTAADLDTPAKDLGAVIVTRTVKEKERKKELEGRRED